MPIDKWWITSTWNYTIGLLIKGSTDFGHVAVSGLILVPYPPTRIMAFMSEDIRISTCNLFLIIIYHTQRIEKRRNQTQWKNDLKKGMYCLISVDSFVYFFSDISTNWVWGITFPRVFFRRLDFLVSLLPPPLMICTTFGV